MIVCKFGGSSVCSKEALLHVKRIIEKNKDYYIFHRENTLSFGCVGIYEYKKERFAKVYFEGIQSIGNIIETKDKLSLPIKMPNSKEFSLTINDLTAKTHRKKLNINDKVYNEWCTIIGKKNPIEEKRKEEKASRKTFSIILIIIAICSTLLGIFFLSNDEVLGYIGCFGLAIYFIYFSVRNLLDK